MRKNKKLIAILTLVIFAMTLVPFAAMAATVAADASTFATEDANATFEVGDATKVKAIVDLNDASGKPVAGATDKVLVWAETTANQPSTGMDVVDGGTPYAAITGVWEVTPVEGQAIIELDFLREGTYTLKAALAEGNVGSPAVPAIDNVGDFVNKLTVPASNSKVVVTKPSAATEDYKITVTPDPITGVNANGIESVKAVVKVVDADDVAVKNTAVTVRTNSNAITTDKAEYTTDYKGEFTVKVKGTVEGTYKLYVEIGDKKETVEVTVAATYATEIEVSKKPDNKLALNTDSDDLKDSLQFTVTDNNGNMITKEATSNPGLDKTLANISNEYVTVTAPDGSKLESKDLRLVFASSDPDEENANYLYINFLNGKKLDKEGVYTFKVYLENGKYATASVEVAKFGTAKKLVVDYKAEVAELKSKVEKPEVYFLDENGVRKDLEEGDFTIGYNGHAVKTWSPDGSFEVDSDVALIGSTVKVTVVAEDEGLTAVDTILIGEGGSAMTFNDNKGEVGTNNREEFQIVDEKGNKVALGNGLADTNAVSIVLSNQSNPDAKVSATDVSNNDLVKEGLGKLSLISDKQTTVDVAVIVKDGAGRLYAGNMTYTFGPSSSVDGQIVVMTIGSQDTIVNNNIVKIDAAPMVNADWRTMVPFRALAENFGATVEWNETDKTVTATLDGVTVVMTIDSTEYTVNGEKKTMDTKPVIVDGRTMVPVRFVAEAFGFKVTPTFAADGTTASVAFMR